MSFLSDSLKNISGTLGDLSRASRSFKSAERAFERAGNEKGGVLGAVKSARDVIHGLKKATEGGTYAERAADRAAGIPSGERYHPSSHRLGDSPLHNTTRALGDVANATKNVERGLNDLKRLPKNIDDIGDVAKALGKLRQATGHAAKAIDYTEKAGGRIAPPDPGERGGIRVTPYNPAPEYPPEPQGEPQMTVSAREPVGLAPPDAGPNAIRVTYATTDHFQRAAARPPAAAPEPVLNPQDAAMVQGAIRLMGGDAGPIDGIQKELTNAGAEAFIQDHPELGVAPGDMKGLATAIRNELNTNPDLQTRMAEIVQQGENASPQDVKAVQAVLNAEDANLALDGDIGPLTKTAFTTHMANAYPESAMPDASSSAPVEARPQTDMPPPTAAPLPVQTFKV